MKTNKLSVPVQIASRALSPVEAIAIAGITKDDPLKEMKKKLAPGAVKTGSVTLRVDYTVTKGQPSEAKPTSNLLSLPVLAKALRLSGIQRDNFYACLKQVALEAMSAKEKVGDQMTAEDAKVLLEINNLDAEVLTALPKKPVAGRVSVATKVTVFEEESESLMPQS